MFRTVLFAFLIALSTSSSRLVADETVKTVPATPEFYSQLAPFIDEETSFVARLNFASFDFEIFSKTILDAERAELERIGFDETATERTLRSLESILRQTETAYEIQVADLVAETETSEIFVVGALKGNDFWGFVVVPTVNKSDAALDALRSFISEKIPRDLGAFVERRNLAFVWAFDRDADETNAFLNDFVAAPNPNLERAVAESAAGGDPTFFLGVATFPFEKILEKERDAFAEFIERAEARNIPLKSFLAQHSENCVAVRFLSTSTR